MSIFSPCFKKLIKTYDEIKVKTNKVSKELNVSSKDKTQFIKNLDSAYFRIRDNCRGHKRSSIHMFFKESNDALERIDNITDAINKGRMLYFLANSFWGRIAGFKGHKKELKVLVDDFSKTFDEINSYAVEYDNIFVSYHHDDLELKRYLDKKEALSKKREDVGSKAEENDVKHELDGVSQDYMVVRSRRKEELNDLSAKQMRILNLIHGYKRTYNTMVQDTISNIDYFQEEKEENLERADVKAREQQIIKEVHGDPKDFQSENPFLVKQVIIRTELSEQQLQQIGEKAGEIIEQKMSEFGVATKEDVVKSENNVKAFVGYKFVALEKQIADLKSLSNEELINAYTEKLKETFATPHKDEEKEEKIIEALPEEAEVVGRNIPLRARVECSIKHKDYIGAFANIRATLDGYFKYVRGVELTDSQRLYPLPGGNTKAEYFASVFGKDGWGIMNIWKDCSDADHYGLKFFKSSDEELENKISQHVDIMEKLHIDMGDSIVPGLRKLIANSIADLKKYLSSGDGERRKVKFVVNNAANNIRYLISIGEDVSEYENDVKELKTMVKEEDYEDFKGLVAFGFPKAK